MKLKNPPKKIRKPSKNIPQLKNFPKGEGLGISIAVIKHHNPYKPGKGLFHLTACSLSPKSSQGRNSRQELGGRG